MLSSTETGVIQNISGFIHWALVSSFVTDVDVCRMNACRMNANVIQIFNPLLFEYLENACSESKA